MFTWALLIAAPVFSQAQRWAEPRIVDGEPEWLLETEAEVRGAMSQPAMSADFGRYRSWQYRIGGEVEHDDFSHVLVFRKADGRLISMTRNYVPERNVDAFFPPDRPPYIRRAGSACGCGNYRAAGCLSGRADWGGFADSWC